jgi:hypothetical protein
MLLIGIAIAITSLESIFMISHTAENVQMLPPSNHVLDTVPRKTLPLEPQETQT